MCGPQLCPVLSIPMVATELIATRFNLRPIAPFAVRSCAICGQQLCHDLSIPMVATELARDSVQFAAHCTICGQRLRYVPSAADEPRSAARTRLSGE